MRRIARCVLALAVLAGCREQRSEPAPTPSATEPAPSVSVTPAARPSAARPSSTDGASPAPVGGNWLKCYASFSPRNEPKLEVMRLGLLCGPSNGMRRVTDAREATVSGEGAGREHRFSAEAGDCYRVFAVGEPSVQDLDVEVFDARGGRIAWDTSDDRWPIVNPDGPFCVTESGEYRAVVRAQRGSGRYATEIWRLR